MKLTLLGATQTVTGSKFLIETKDRRILVDCGLFQGSKELRLRNWEQPPVDPKSIDAVVLTHAHIDHTGYLPRFVAHGYKGPVYATPATATAAMKDHIVASHRDWDVEIPAYRQTYDIN